LSKHDAAYLDSIENKFEILHNHPGSSIPSTSDVEGLFQRKNAAGSTVICHNGTIYRMKKLKNISNICTLIERMEKNAYSAYPGHSDDMLEYQIVTDLIRYLERKNIVEYTRR